MVRDSNKRVNSVVLGMTGIGKSAKTLTKMIKKWKGKMKTLAICHIPVVKDMKFYPIY